MASDAGIRAKGFSNKRDKYGVLRVSDVFMLEVGFPNLEENAVTGVYRVGYLPSYITDKTKVTPLHVNIQTENPAISGYSNNGNVVIVGNHTFLFFPYIDSRFNAVMVRFERLPQGTSLNARISFNLQVTCLYASEE